MRLEDAGVRDLDQKHVVWCRSPDGTWPRFSLLWRTTGKRGRPLPAIGATLRAPGFAPMVVVRIDPPGSLHEVGPHTMVVTPR